MSPDPVQPQHERLLAAHAAAAGTVRRTPAVLSSASMTERCGGTIALKAECLQRTGSFKLRGALGELDALGGGVPGVVAGSAGNHAQSLAYAARHRGVACEVFMPRDAPVSKLEAVSAFGAHVHRQGSTVGECVELARARAGEAGLAFVHPFDDLDVIAGQAGVGIELAEDVADLRKVVVPVGGGGLAAGVALALAQMRPGVEVVGVQAAERGRATIADGIAIKRPGELTLPLVERWLAELVTVGDDDIAAAMILLLERSKLVVEGAGAAALAALLSGTVAPAHDGITVAVLSGGNVDVALLAAIAAREETRAGRRARLFTRVSDRPGGLAGLLAAVAGADGNLIAVDHVRDGMPLGLRETGVALTVEARGRAHLDQLVAALHDAGYEVDVAA